MHPSIHPFDVRVHERVLHVLATWHRTAIANVTINHGVTCECHGAPRRRRIFTKSALR